MKKPARKSPPRKLTGKERAWFIFNLDYPGEVDRPGSCFRSWEEAEAAWKVCGEEITREFMRAHPGSRPWAWWQWTNRQVSPGICGRDKMQYLMENGLLEPWERAKIEEIYNGKDAESGENEDVFRRLVDGWD